ncbi:metal (Ni/Fe) hydrogenase small subunit [Leptospira ryugenii]|uniref:Metal (Ni/Fe) hydrogenase small subunit n=1 Tax=Leptospira ryugenii TaxID=1917863 RepID=A0A2P2DZ12_9LEPT|nr:4Fe-4S dicluster domain-containing protein [Leptospira ryugenii]GBF49867.1 metal (Ni/Fe) hydrogenase small subunit [Leptospira ryugenii]
MRQILELINFFRPSQVMDWKKVSPIHPKNRGIPTPKGTFESSCGSCQVCVDHCPTAAIQKVSNERLVFDYGACLQCGSCSLFCPEERLKDSGFVHVFSKHRDDLIVAYENGKMLLKVSGEDHSNHLEFTKLTERSGFLYREVAAAGNNTVECELNASFNSVFDSEREGVRCVASPKHADAIVFSGPVSQAMEQPLETAFAVIAPPKALVACGTEAVSGGLFPQGKLPKEPDLFIAGDPPRPDVILLAFRHLMGRFSFSFQEALHKFLQSGK